MAVVPLILKCELPLLLRDRDEPNTLSRRLQTHRVKLIA